MGDARLRRRRVHRPQGDRRRTPHGSYVCDYANDFVGRYAPDGTLLDSGERRVGGRSSPPAARPAVGLDGSVHIAHTANYRAALHVHRRARACGARRSCTRRRSREGRRDDRGRALRLRILIGEPALSAGGRSAAAPRQSPRRGPVQPGTRRRAVSDRQRRVLAGDADSGDGQPRGCADAAIAGRGHIVATAGTTEASCIRAGTRATTCRGRQRRPPGRAPDGSFLHDRDVRHPARALDDALPLA